MDKEEILATAERLASFAATADEQRDALFSMDARPFTLREAAALHQALEKVRMGLMEVSQIAHDMRHRAAQQA
jgi:hypothetical protein